MAKNTMILEIISPDRMFYQGEIQMLEMVTTEGEIGVYPGHIPLVSVLSPGIVAIHEGDEVKYAAVHAGFVEILPDKITVMAEIAEWPGEIDLERAESAKERAKKRMQEKGGLADLTRAELSLRRALTRIELKERFGR